jgi:ElaB/YqjD/DUF883 family membrane-anchored ribosome-binding protein
MSGTIDAIQERLSPDNLKDQARDAVREATIGKAQTMVDDVTYTAREKGATIWDTVRGNPLPTAITAIGIGWLWKNRSHSSTETRYDGRNMYGYGAMPRYDSSRTDMRSMPYGRYDRTGYSGVGASQGYDRTGYDRTGYMDAGSGQQESGGMQERVGEMAGTVQEKAGQAVDQVSHLGSQAADLGSQAVDSMTQLPSQGMHAMRNRYDQTIMESPLALGLIALGVGAAVGLVVPETERENELMGDARDQLVDRAEGMAQETMGKVQQVASQTGDAVQQAVQESSTG